jgi:transcriptional regulator with XRE-family HTH domain
MADQEHRSAFGDYLRSVRIAANLSQCKAAELSGVSAPYLAQIEGGKRNPPSNKVLAGLASVYNVAPDVLWFHADNRGRPPALGQDRIDWAFHWATEDPEYGKEYPMPTEPFTASQKVWLVLIYEKNTGRKMFTPLERESAQALILTKQDSAPAPANRG